MEPNESENPAGENFESGASGSGALPPELARLEVQADALAAIVQVTSRTLRAWRADGMPSLPRGRYPLVAALRWILRYFQAGAAAAPKSKTDAEISMLEVKRKRQELALARESGEVINKDRAKRFIEAGICEASGILLTLPRKIAACVPQESRPDAEERCLDVVAVIMRILRGAENSVDELGAEPVEPVQDAELEEPVRLEGESNENS